MDTILSFRCHNVGRAGGNHRTVSSVCIGDCRACAYLSPRRRVFSRYFVRGTDQGRPCMKCRALASRQYCFARIAACWAIWPCGITVWAILPCQDCCLCNIYLPGLLIGQYCFTTIAAWAILPRQDCCLGNIALPGLLPGQYCFARVTAWEVLICQEYSLLLGKNCFARIPACAIFTH